MTTPNKDIASLDANEGSLEKVNQHVLVTGTRNDTKPKKQRKAQSEEEYNFQYHEFLKSGPRINTDDWLLDNINLESLNKDRKSDRSSILHAIEKAYYDKNYEKCMEIISKAEVFFEVQDPILRESLDKRIRKSAKIERHITDLLYMKEKCKEKLES